MREALNRWYTPMSEYQSRFNKSYQQLFYTRSTGEFESEEDFNLAINGNYPKITLEKVRSFLQAGYQLHQKILLDKANPDQTINSKLEQRNLFRDAFSLTLSKDKRPTSFDQQRSTEAIHQLFYGHLLDQQVKIEQHKKRHGLKMQRSVITSTFSHMLLMPIHKTEFIVSAGQLHDLNNTAWDRKRVYKFVRENWPL